MDAISNVLTPLRSGGATLARALLKRPWGIPVDPMRSPAIHVVLGGECWLRLAGDEQPLRLLQGDALLVGSGVGHTLSDAPDSDVISMREALSIQTDAQAAADIETTALLCAKYQLDDGGPHPLVSLMPPLIHLTRRQIGANEPLGLTLAAKALRETRRSLDEIARAVGYESGPAFSKTFRRLYGEAPGRYRSGRADRI